MKPGRLRTLVLLVAITVVPGAGTAYAALQTVTSSIRFLTDITIATVASPNFGYVKAGQVGTYVLDTTGAVTASGGGVTEGGATAAGHYTIKGSGFQGINISDGNYTAVGASTPSAAKCKYGAGSEAACNGMTGAGPTSSGTVLLVGLTVTTTAAGADNQSDTPHFDLTFLYQ